MFPEINPIYLDKVEMIR